MWRPYRTLKEKNKTEQNIIRNPEATTQLDQVFPLAIPSHFSNIHIITRQTRVLGGFGGASVQLMFQHTSHFYFKRVGRPSHGDSEKRRGGRNWKEGAKLGKRVVEGHMISSSCSPSETVGHMGKKLFTLRPRKFLFYFQVVT